MKQFQPMKLFHLDFYLKLSLRGNCALFKRTAEEGERMPEAYSALSTSKMEHLRNS